MDKNKTSIRSLITILRIGQTVTFPLNRLNSVRVTAYSYGLESGKQFKTSTDRDAKTIVVTRIK